MSLRLALLVTAPLLLLGIVGCASRGDRTRLPTGLAGPPPPIDERHRTAVTPERVRLTRDYLAQHHPAFLATLPAGDGPEAIGFTPRIVVVHYTAIPTLEGTLEAFAPLEIDGTRPLVRAHGRLNVGIHYVVDRDGTIYGLLPDTVVARHTIGLNHVAIGIENVGDGDLGSRASAPLTAAQVTANAALVRHLRAKYPTIDFLVGHSEYTDLERPSHPAHALFHEAVPSYRTAKVDPGRRFLRALRRELSRQLTRDAPAPRRGR